MRDVPGIDSLERTDGPPRDSVLLERVATGDRQALAELVARYSASLYALAFAILSDPAEAQEIVDAAFREVRWEARHFHPTHYPVGRWLTDATREAATERRRVAKRC
jgi:RNA polymerase sigma-70 factor (ECF subfamily)